METVMLLIMIYGSWGRRLLVVWLFRSLHFFWWWGLNIILLMLSLMILLASFLWSISVYFWFFFYSEDLLVLFFFFIFYYSVFYLNRFWKCFCFTWVIWQFRFGMDFIRYKIFFQNLWMKIMVKVNRNDCFKKY